jgi:hypothetical protein
MVETLECMTTRTAPTACPSGHQYTPENTKWRVDLQGHRSRNCRECARLDSAARRSRKHRARLRGDVRPPEFKPKRCETVTGPTFTGAACVGSPHFIERAREQPARREYRENHALAICRTCPVLAECRAWLDSLPQTHRPPGVVAGIIWRPGHNNGTTKEKHVRTA